MCKVATAHAKKEACSVCLLVLALLLQPPISEPVACAMVGRRVHGDSGRFNAYASAEHASARQSLGRKRHSIRPQIQFFGLSLICERFS